MGNTAEKLLGNQPIVIGYIGGSITEGAWASNPEKTSWRALVTDWFKTSYPRSSITEVNATIGGTGSDLAAFRCRYDLLAFTPDLVFVEFAANDVYSEPERILWGMEGLVRQILTHSSSTDILMVFTTTKKDAETCNEESCSPVPVKYHSKVAEYYQVPCINVGKYLCEAMSHGRGSWETLTVDGVHPCDAGYKIYAEAVINFLGNYLTQQRTARTWLPPLSVNSRSFENGSLLDAWAYAADGWEKQSCTMAGKYPHMLASGRPGAELTIPFWGNVIGIYWLIAPDSGDIEWSVDDSVFGLASSWDEWALQFTRANYRIFSDNLPDGSHVLKLRILPTHHAESTGTTIRIGAFLAEYHMPCAYSGITDKLLEE